MGFGVTELIIILVIVLVLFGAKRLKNVGSDLGSAVKGFKSAIKDEETKPNESIEKSESTIIDGEATKIKEEDKA
ncbi:MAG: twin-arginine translocase TatA/TatE family subunit [Woeseiaceae bacterium]